MHTYNFNSFVFISNVHVYFTLFISMLISKCLFYNVYFTIFLIFTLFISQYREKMLYSPFRYRVTNHAFITWIFFYAIMEGN